MVVRCALSLCASASEGCSHEGCRVSKYALFIWRDCWNTACLVTRRRVQLFAYEAGTTNGAKYGVLFHEAPLARCMGHIEGGGK